MLVHWNWNDSDGLIHSIPNRKKKKLEFSLKICIKRTMFHLALMLASHMLTGVGVNWTGWEWKPHIGQHMAHGQQPSRLGKSVLQPFMCWSWLCPSQWHCAESRTSSVIKRQGQYEIMQIQRISTPNRPTQNLSLFAFLTACAYCNLQSSPP
jgi:hypothetical protein